MTTEIELHDQRCPTCGRYVSLDDGYGDLPPGGIYDASYIVAYCNETCAERKSPPAIYEGEE